MEVRFQHVQDPKAPLECTYEGTQYKLWNGHTYDLPEDFVDWLNSRAYPIYESIPDPDNPKEMKTVKVGETPRFVVSPLPKKKTVDEVLKDEEKKEGEDPVEEEFVPINQRKKKEK